jgi:hypothetical protein
MIGTFYTAALHDEACAWFSVCVGVALIYGIHGFL